MSVDPQRDPVAAIDSSTLQRRAARGVVWSVLQVGVSLPIAVVVNIVLARLLGVHGYGRLAVLTASIEIAFGLIDVGTSAALIQFGARAHAAGHTSNVQSLLSKTQGFRLFWVAPLLTVFVIVAVDVAPSLKVLAVVFGVWLPAMLGGLTDCLIVESKSAQAAKIGIGASLVVQAGVVTAAAISRNADTTWAVRLLLSAVTPVVCLFVISHPYRSSVLRPRLPHGFPSGFWKFALPTAVAGIISGLVVSRSEVLILGWLSTPQQVGLFAMAFGVSSHLFAPANTITGPLMPALSGMHAVDAQALPGTYLRVARISSVICALVLAILTPIAACLIAPVYGSGFAAAGSLLMVLAIGGAASSLAGPATAFVFARLSSGRFLKINIACLVLDFALAFALIPWLNAWGAVIAAVGGAMLRLVLLVRDEATHLRLSAAQLLACSATLLTTGTVLPVVWFTLSALNTPILARGLGVMLVATSTLLLSIHRGGTGLRPADARSLQRIIPKQLAPVAQPLLRLLTSREPARNPGVTNG